MSFSLQKEKFIHLRKLLNFEVEILRIFFDWNILLLRYVLCLSPHKRKKSTPWIIFSEKIYFTSCVDFFRLRRATFSPRANDGARSYIKALANNSIRRRSLVFLWRYLPQARSRARERWRDKLQAETLEQRVNEMYKTRHAARVRTYHTYQRALANGRSKNDYEPYN